MGLLHLHRTPELYILQTKPSPIFAIKIKDISLVKKFSYGVPGVVVCLSWLGVGGGGGGGGTVAPRAVAVNSEIGTVILVKIF